MFAENIKEGVGETTSSCASELTRAQFDKWQSLLLDRLGLALSFDQCSRLQMSLSIRMREIDCDDIDNYYEQICELPAGLPEWLTLVERLVICETRFYRDAHAMALAYVRLKQQVQENPNKSLAVWSVGCSSGEESYTLAFLCDHLFGEFGKPSRFGVTGVDVSKTAIDMARAGFYDARRVADLPKKWRRNYFETGASGDFKVKSFITQRVCFARQNIVDIGSSPVRQQDLIFCQNVLIYFSKEVRHAILDSLAKRLAPGGCLVIGAGEALEWSHPSVERIKDKRALAYVRTAA